MRTAGISAAIPFLLMLAVVGALAFDDWGTEVWPTPDNTKSNASPYYAGDIGNDNLWEYYWNFHGHVWVSCSDSKYRENSPLITTTVTGLDPTKAYDVYVYYFDRTLSDNLPGVMMAALHGEPLIRCDRSNSEWEIVYYPENIERYRKLVGTVSNVSTFSVDVDDVTDASGRAMYAGIEYKEASFGVLQGSITIQNFAGDDMSIAPVRVQFLQGDVVRQTRIVTLSVNGGSYSIDNVPQGSYAVKFKIASSLVRAYPVAVTGGGITVQNVQLVSGDIDGDNEITTADLSISLKNTGLIGD